MRDGSFWTGESGFGYSSGAWPDGALERGLPRPLAKKRENWGPMEAVEYYHFGITWKQGSTEY
jgi:hypothetical protein